jgi:hypothetical protein
MEKAVPSKGSGQVGPGLGGYWRAQEIPGIYGNGNSGQRSPQIKIEKAPCVTGIKGGEDICSSGASRTQMLAFKIPERPMMGTGTALWAPQGRNTGDRE